MKLYIPALYDRLRLTEDWVIRMEDTKIDHSLQEYLHGPSPFWWEGQDKIPGALGIERVPAGTILGVDRIYIRRSKKDYDSITFTIRKTKDKPGARFWVPLKEANNIVFEPVES